MHVRADGRALVTGSADKDVKFWDFEEKRSDSDQVFFASFVWYVYEHAVYRHKTAHLSRWFTFGH